MIVSCLLVIRGSGMWRLVFGGMLSLIVVAD